MNEHLELPLSAEVERLKKVIEEYKAYDKRRGKLLEELNRTVAAQKNRIKELEAGVLTNKYKMEIHKLRDKVRALEMRLERLKTISEFNGGIKELNQLYTFDKRNRLLKAERDKLIEELVKARRIIKELQDGKVHAESIEESNSFS